MMEVEKRKMHCSKCGEEGHKRTSKKCKLYQVVRVQDVLPQEKQDDTTDVGLEDDTLNQVLDDIEDKSSDDEYDLEEQTATIFIDENNTVQYIQCDDDSSEDEDNDCRVS